MAARGKGKLILLCLLLSACNRGEQEPPPESSGDSVAPARTVEPLSDNEALDVLMALSATGVSSATVAPEAVTAPELRRYLGVVRADHEALAAELGVIADSLELTPESHSAADRIRAAASPGALPADGAADEAVLERQIALHRLFLAALDSAVLSGPREQLLGQYASAMRPTVAAHLQRAEQLDQLLRDRRPTGGLPAGGAPSGPPATSGTGQAGEPRPTPPETTATARPDTLSSR